MFHRKTKQILDCLVYPNIYSRSFFAFSKLRRLKFFLGTYMLFQVVQHGHGGQMIIQAGAGGGLKQVQQIQQPGQITQAQLQQLAAESGQQVQVQQEILSGTQQPGGESGQLMPSELMASVDQMNEGGVGVINDGVGGITDTLEDGEALQVQGEETVVTSEPHDPQNGEGGTPELQ